MGSDSDEDGGEYEDTDRNKGHKKQHRRRRRPHSAWRLFKLALTSALGACVLLLLVRMWHVDITSDAARADQYMYRPAPHVRDVCHAVQVPAVPSSTTSLRHTHAPAPPARMYGPPGPIAE